MTDRTTQVLHYAAFTKDGRGGNPAGVVLHAADLFEDAMLAIAAEVGYSETAFITERHGAGRYGVRYFSPLAEVPFCGHATIALAAALADHETVEQLHLATKAGEIVVDMHVEASGAVVATLTSVASHTHAASADEIARALTALRWGHDVLDSRYPVHVAYAGATHLVLAVKDRQTLASLDYDFAALSALMAELGWVTIQIVWAETPLRFHARNPFPPGGVREDPATGAAAAALGGYLRALQLVEPPAEVTILQGDDNGTPSLLTVELLPAVATVRVSGRSSLIRAA